MNNPNPFVPQGSLLDQQSKRQSRMKLAVFCVLAISVTGLMAMLIQGCKRNAGSGTDTADNSASTVDTNAATTLGPEPTNMVAEGSNNMAPPTFGTNMAPPPMPAPAPMPTPTPTPVPPIVDNSAPAPGAEYVVVHGDTFGKIAKKYGVSTKALENANPNVQPTKLKVGQKLTIPAGGKTVADVGGSTGAASVSTDGSTEVYVVKAGDTLTKIAKAHGTTVKAIEAANNLTTTKISVGKKLKIPVKAEAAPAAPVDNTPAPVVAPAPAPVTTLPPVNTPSPAPAPAPAPTH